jgi:hypothetical protein
MRTLAQRACSIAPLSAQRSLGSSHELPKVPPRQQRANLDDLETPIDDCRRKRELGPNALLASHRKRINAAVIAEPTDGELVRSHSDIGKREVTGRIRHSDLAGGDEFNPSFAKRSPGVAVQHRSGYEARHGAVGGNAGFCQCRWTRWFALRCITPSACEHGGGAQEGADPRAFR